MVLNNLKKISFIACAISGACIILNACAAPTPDNNLGFLMESTGNYTAQDSDTLQNGYQEFQGQLNYAAGHDQDAAAVANDSQEVQDKMYDEYQSQIKAQQQQ